MKSEGPTPDALTVSAPPQKFPTFSLSDKTWTDLDVAAVGVKKHAQPKGDHIMRHPPRTFRWRYGKSLEYSASLFHCPPVAIQRLLRDADQTDNKA